MPVRSMTLTTRMGSMLHRSPVSDACQINDFDHLIVPGNVEIDVSDACQINDFDHHAGIDEIVYDVSDACQINDFDH